LQHLDFLQLTLVETAQQMPQIQPIGLMLFNRGHAEVGPLLGQRFKLLTPKVQQSYQKVILTEKYQNFATKGFIRTPIHVFMPSFMEIGKVEVTKRVCVVFITKKGRYFPLLCCFWSNSPKIL